MDAHSQETRKVSNFKALCQTLVTYRVVTPKEQETPEEACAAYLRKADKIALPTAVLIKSKDGDPNGDRYMPYRIFPTAAMETLNSSVRFLEYCLQRDNTPGRVEPETRTNPYNDPEIREGVLQLATLLVPNCLIPPEQDEDFQKNKTSTPEDAGGGTLLHRSNPKDPSKPILTKRAKLLKGLLGRLEKYESIRLAFEGKNQETSPTLKEVLRLQHLLEQELRASVSAWKMLRDQVDEKTQSLDAMGFSEGQKALEDHNQDEDHGGDYDDGGFEDPLDADEDHQDRLAAAHYYGEPPATGTAEVEETEKKRKNLPCEPEGWLWRETTDPMGFITNYVSEELLPRIEEKKENLLAAFQSPNLSQKEKEETLLILPERKYNPNDYWKMLGNLAKDTPEEDTRLREKLASARFAVCLKETNLKMGIPHGEFLPEWEETVRKHLTGEKPQASRNHALLATLRRLPSCGDWHQTQLDQWIEELQTLAPGGYENTSAQEKNRTQIVDGLNKTLGKIRDGMEKNAESQEGKPTENLESLFEQVAKGITKSLSGPTGQTVRRELRYHVKTLKDHATSRREKQEAENFSQLWKWLTSISSQIKDGSWHEPATQEITHKVVRGMILDILSQEIGRRSEEIFKVSPSPVGKNELELCVEFLKAISGDNATQGFAGRNLLDRKIQEANNQLLASREKNLGTNIAPKVWLREKNSEDLPNKIRACEEAERLLLQKVGPRAEKVQEPKEFLQSLFNETETQLQILLDGPESDEVAEKNLAFWEALNSLCENIRMRKERPQFQPSALGRRMVKTCAKLARDNYTGTRSVPQHIRETLHRNSRKMVLLSNAIAPVGLWINAPKKGRDMQTPHSEILQSFKERKTNRERILQLFQNESRENLQQQLKSETVVAFATNLSSLDETAGFLKDPQELANAILWQHRHPKEVQLLAEKNPEKDSPIDRFQLHSAKKTPNKKAPAPEEPEMV